MNYIRASRITVTFSESESGAPPVFLDFSLEIGSSELVGVLGPNGCGKTTLLRVLAGLLSPVSGEVLVAERPAWKTVCGYVPQDYRMSLFPWLRVDENIAFGPRIRGTARHQAREEARHFAARVAPNLPLDRYPYELSGGQQQLVTLLRAFFLRPELLLLDEPFGSLDRRVRNASRENLLRLWGELRPTTVLVSHDPDDVLAVCNRILVLGGRPARIVTDVRSPSVTSEITKLRTELEETLGNATV